MAQANRDQNRVTTLLGTSNADQDTPINIWADPTTHRLFVDMITNFSANARVDTPETFEDTDFLTGDSPATLDANTALGRNATEFMIINDGGGMFTVSISNDGAAFGDEHTMKQGETWTMESISVDSIRITWVGDSAYRVVVL